MAQQFDDQLLVDFSHRFYGYGSYSGEVWFIGMEEGGGGSFEEISRRLRVWAARGKRELEDAADYHAAIGITELFADPPKRQPTWSGLIRMLLSSTVQLPTNEQVREYQRASLGRSSGKTCLLELLPLPSPSTGHWLYAQHSELACLADRDTYRLAYLDSREAHLRQRIKEHRPPFVIFYGLN